MVFIPRDPVVQNQFLVHDSAEGSTLTAGCVVFLSDDQKVACVSGTDSTPYGFIMQGVKAESSAHPTGFRLPGDLGSSDAFTGDPVAVAHLGLYDTTTYVAGLVYTAGDYLGVNSAGELLPASEGAVIAFDDNNGQLVHDEVAVAQNTLTAAQSTAGNNLRIKLLI